MIRSFAFTVQGRLHTENIDLFLMPTLLADTNLFLWVDFENPTPEEVQTILAGVYSILSPSHVDGTVPATAPSGAPIPEGPRSTAPATPIPEGPPSTAPATKAPSAAPIRVDGAVGQANLIKKSTSDDASVYRPS